MVWSRPMGESTIEWTDVIWNPVEGCSIMSAALNAHGSRMRHRISYIDWRGLRLESALRRERQAEGIAAARRRGVYRGWPSRIDMDSVRASIAEGQSPTGAAYRARDGTGKNGGDPLKDREPVP